jgi:CO/xanthine dehydrogenase Mo-binding subunit
MRPGPVLGQSAPAKLPADLEANRRLDSRLKINPEGNIEIFTGKVELGQGNLTALAQIAAEELDVAFERVRMRPVDTSHSPDEGYTAGSASIEVAGSALRYAAANARAVLLEMAAAKLGVAIDSLTVDDGVVGSSGAASQVTYWRLSLETPLARNASNVVSPKSPSQYRTVGTSVPRLDIPAKLTGGEAYVQDIRALGNAVRPGRTAAQL